MARPAQLSRAPPERRPRAEGAKRTLGLALHSHATPPALSLSPGPSNSPQTARISELKRGAPRADGPRRRAKRASPKATAGSRRAFPRRSKAWSASPRPRLSRSSIQRLSLSRFRVRLLQKAASEELLLGHARCVPPEVVTPSRSGSHLRDRAAALPRWLYAAASRVCDTRPSARVRDSPECWIPMDARASSEPGRVPELL
jgi:hypothetical protein